MRLCILGAGKYGKEIEDIAEQTGKYQAIYFLDDNASCALGKCSDYIEQMDSDTEFYVAFGNNELRKKWINTVKETGGKLATIVHPTAYISPKAKIGTGVAVLPMALINTNSVIEDGCMINSGAIIDHDVTIGECTHICVGAIVKADNKIPDGIKIEAGTVIERNTYNRGGEKA